MRKPKNFLLKKFKAIPLANQDPLQNDGKSLTYKN